jgi:hypothetical protein
MVIKLKNKLLLKKSFSVRKNFDIILNSRYLVILHIDKIYGELYENLKMEMFNVGAKVFLLNKDRVILSSFSSVAKGPTLMVYSNNFFYFRLVEFIKKSKNFFQILLIKNENFLSTYRFNLLNFKYSNFSLMKVSFFFFFLISFYKNLLFFIQFFFKFLFKKLLFVFKQNLYKMLYLTFFIKNNLFKNQ